MNEYRDLEKCWRITSDAIEQVNETVAEETPAAIIYNDWPFAVMLTTPSNLEDFAYGFSLTEGIVERIEDIEDISVEPVSQGLEVHVTLKSDLALLQPTRRQRNLAGRTGCGLCGVDNFSDALRSVPPVADMEAFSPASILRAIDEIPALQLLNQKSGAVHAAAFADRNGAITHLREDVGRHNALDKLIGALLVDRVDFQSGFVLVTSRCSYEMALKTALTGIGLIAAISAPTALAIDLANRANLALAARTRGGGFTLYAAPSRVKGVIADPS